MSMNLTCKDQGKDIDLWQTPTCITWMCLSIHPATRKPDGGHEGVRRRYIEWVKGQMNGTYTSKEDMDLASESIQDHIKDIQALKRPRFSYI